jgi:transcriptional regulator with XRE-family HTH domain
MGAPAPIRRQLATVLRTRREELSLSQEAVAARCDMSPRYLRSLESGRSTASVETLARLLPALDWTWADVAERLDPEPQRATGAPPDIHRVLDELWAAASLRERKVIRRVLAGFR